MFLARLAEADAEVKSDFKAITPQKGLIQCKRDLPSSDVKYSQASDSKQHSSVIENFAEYLFDLFDANCMEDFHRMEAFENRALQHFADISNDNGEYSLIHTALHREFLSLFEELLQNFLSTEGVTIDEFYTELEKYSKAGSQDARISENAKEVVEVVSFYTTFESWAKMMKEQARQRNGYVNYFSDKIQTALQEEGGCSSDC